MGSENAGKTYKYSCLDKVAYWELNAKKTNVYLSRGLTILIARLDDKPAVGHT